MKRVIRGWFFLVLQISRWEIEIGRCFSLVVILVSCGCCRYVSLPRGAMEWSAVFYHLLTFTMCHQQLASTDTSA